MPKLPPSIFNDVIGPVMRGPSSSHTAASIRIGSMARQLLGEIPAKVMVDVDKLSSLATTHTSQGSDMGLMAGLLGMEVFDPRIAHSVQIAREQGIAFDFNTGDFKDPHPNTYRITLEKKNGEKLTLRAISTGGGMMELIMLDELEISLLGDYFETIVICDDVRKEQLEKIYSKVTDTRVEFEVITKKIISGKGVINIKGRQRIPDSEVAVIAKISSVGKIYRADPVLPVLSSGNMKVPYLKAEDLMKNLRQGEDLYQKALQYEMMRGGFSEQEILDLMKSIVDILVKSIHAGLNGTEYADRILGPQARKIMVNKEKLIPFGVGNRVTAFIMALMEQKSAMGIIVAAPTAGSCGTLPGTLIGTASDINKQGEDIIKAFLAAGLVGVFIAHKATFAAEEIGCQAETGAGAGMAAAGLVQLMGGSVEQALAAASIALQNEIGLVCDPVANRVEVPCLGKNVMAGMNAIASANMVMAGVNQVIPFDEVVEAMDKSGRMLPRELCCTGLGGLSVTPTSKKIEEMLAKRQGE
jgi:L-serine dehydratase